MGNFSICRLVASCQSYKLQQTCPVHQVAASLLKSGLLLLFISDLQTCWNNYQVLTINLQQFCQQLSIDLSSTKCCMPCHATERLPTMLLTEGCPLCKWIKNSAKPFIRICAYGSTIWHTYWGKIDCSSVSCEWNWTNGSTLEADNETYETLKSTLTPGRPFSMLSNAKVVKLSTNVAVNPPCKVPPAFWCSSSTVNSHTILPGSAAMIRT